MTFREREKKRYEALKGDLFPGEAQAQGQFNGIPRSFCLADGHSADNLHSSFREEAIAYFKQRKIGWHNGISDSNGEPHPSNHLCCSQCFCVNSLWPLVRNAALLTGVFRPFYPELAEPLRFDADESLIDNSKPFLAFEWIGSRNYLNEPRWGNRGANATSADFAFRFRRYDGRIQLVLGEWKYTESYGSSAPESDVLNRRRRDIYRVPFELWKAASPDLPAYESLFAEPFYQLMRQTLLAQEMQRTREEMGAEIVSVLHVSPKANLEFAANFKAAPGLARYGRTVGEAWTRIAPQHHFLSASTESLLTVIEQVAPSAMLSWSDYLLKRYGWWR